MEIALLIVGVAMLLMIIVALNLKARSINREEQPKEENTLQENNIPQIENDTVSLSDEKLTEQLLIRQANDIHIIKNCVVFFTVVSIIGGIIMAVFFIAANAAIN